MLRLLPALRLCCLLVLPADYVMAQTQSGNLAEGHQLAQTWCSNCHLVDPNGQSRATDVAPSFASVANMPSTTSAALHAFLTTPHPPMPDFRLSRTEMDDVVAYILSLRGK
ncbi:MAG: cytochrome c [Acetobacteraceae bacterium]|nr:cytochrome c [Acetobacteraceae bacterium]MBV8575040.1 cytochrome c [Acetobacteraceae bacterium]